MKLAELDNLYNELVKEETPISPDAVISALNNATLPIDKIVDNVEKVTHQSVKPPEESNFNMGEIYATALADCFANPDSEQQTKNLNRILFPIMLREGMKIEKTGEPVQYTPKDLLKLFQDLHSPRAKEYGNCRNCLFISAIPANNYSITCGCLRLRDIPASKLNCLRAYLRKTARGSRIILTCEEVPVFTPSIAVMRRYNRIDAKLVKTGGDWKLVSWAIGQHPDRPFVDEMDRICLLGKMKKQ